MPTRNRLAIILSLLFLISFLIYTGFEAKKLIYGPQIILNSPKDGETLQGIGVVVVSGNTKNITFVTLNGRQIFTDANGNFNENLVLLPGYNIITISAKGRYGKEISKRLHLYLVKDVTNTFVPSTISTSTATSTQTNFSSKNLNGQAATSTATSSESTTTKSSIKK